MTVTETKWPPRNLWAAFEGTPKLRRRGVLGRGETSLRSLVSVRVCSEGVGEASLKGRCVVTLAAQPLTAQPGTRVWAQLPSFLKRGQLRRALRSLPALTSSEALKGSFDFVHVNLFKKPEAAFLGNDNQ